MRIVITGATSFIGVNVIAGCIARGYEVCAVARKNSSNIGRIPRSNKISIIELDMKEYSHLPELIDSADAFVHLAWEGTRAPYRDDANLQQGNYEAAIVAMNMAYKLGCKAFLGSGSQAEYGIMDGDVNEEYPCNPCTEYGMKKLLTCEKLQELANDTGMRYVWTRIFSVYGEHDDPRALIMSTLEKMRKNEPIALTACTQMWDFLHVKDAANAIISLIENEQTEGIYNLASGEKKPLRYFVEEMREVLHSNSKLEFGTVPYGANGPVDLRPDISKIAGTGWKPQINFRDGILGITQEDFS